MAKNVHDEVWHSLGEQDPDWAVATTAGKRHGAWADELDTFYTEGRKRVDEALGMMNGLQFGRALDWGSGTGRLSFALATRFERVTCADVSTTMLATLETRARERGVANVDLLAVNRFHPSGDHDLALSLITLQHLPSRAAIASALRVIVAALRPGGQLLVEIPLRPHKRRHRLQPRWLAYRLLRRLGVSASTLHAGGLSGISMVCVPKDWVCRVLSGAGAQVLDARERHGTSHQQVYYVAQRR